MSQTMKTLNGYEIVDNYARTQITAEKAALKQEIATERKRIDALASLPEGSTAGDAELVDAHIDYTGKNWESTGAHIRGVTSQLSQQIDDISEATIHEENVYTEIGELFDSTQVQTNKAGTNIVLASASGYTAKKLTLSNETKIRLTFNASNDTRYGVGYFFTKSDGTILSQCNKEAYGRYVEEIEISTLPQGTEIIYVNNNASEITPNIENIKVERKLITYTKNEIDRMILLNYIYPVMFDRIAVIGDSLASGELVYKNENGDWIYQDVYGNSWLSNLAKQYGSSARTHYSAGGMTCKKWLEDYTAKLNLDTPFNAYFIALGTNDEYKKPYEMGTVNDEVGSNTFAGYYKQIIEVVKAKAPNSVVFCVSKYNGDTETLYNTLIKNICELYDGCFYVDLVNKSDLSLADGGVFVSGSHFTTLGYIRIARNISHIVNDIVIDNAEWFKFFALNNSVGEKYND